ncbi:H-NS histone family protein [Burkholderia territorii]|uniref:H-NS histone family protein n=1 Tax=Burkholderia territorii TaxID=1503055 RepID=UPI0009BE8A80|nr:H-NS histone family protein [Burkholderia territorii]
MTEPSDYPARRTAPEEQVNENNVPCRKKVLAEILMAVAEFQFTLDELFPDVRKRKAHPRYFDPVSGATWSGRGREPHWIRGKDRRTFELDSGPPANEPER